MKEALRLTGQSHESMKRQVASPLYIYKTFYGSCTGSTVGSLLAKRLKFRGGEESDIAKYKLFNFPFLFWSLNNQYTFNFIFESGIEYILVRIIMYNILLNREK